MVSLFILLSLMTTIQKVDEVKLQPVQQAVEFDKPTFSRGSMWYTWRPINAPSQVMNIERYLDSINWEAITLVPQYVEYTIPSYTYITTWKLDWGDGWWFTIPLWWTYMIQYELWTVDVATIVIFDVMNWWDVIYTKTFDDSTVSWVSWARFFNADKWDFITIRITSSEEITVNTSVWIIKLS